MSDDWNALYETTEWMHAKTMQVAYGPDLQLSTTPTPEPPDMTDNQWLSAVAICLHEELNCVLGEAVDIVHDDRIACLLARKHRIAPRQLAQFMSRELKKQWAARAARAATKRSVDPTP